MTDQTIYVVVHKPTEPNFNIPAILAFCRFLMIAFDKAETYSLVGGIFKLKPSVASDFVATLIECGYQATIEESADAQLWGG